MEIALRIAAAAILGAAAALLMKRGGGALALPLAAAVCVYALFLALGALSPAVELLRRALALSGLTGAYVQPLVKCVAIGILSRLASDLCRDNGQSALAGAVELGGAAAALLVSLPLLETLLTLVEKLL